MAFTLVGAERQHFRSASGLDPTLAAVGSVPLSHSLRQHVVESGAALAVPDGRRCPLLGASRAAAELGVAAYLGVPVRGPSGHVLGAVCAFDVRPRTWTGLDREAFAWSVEADLARRARLNTRVLRDALAAMTYEIRTPLTTILCYAALLLDEADPALAADALAIRDGGGRLLRTLCAVPDWVAFEAGLFPIAPQPVDLGAHVRRAVEAGRPAEGPLPIRVEAPGAGPLVWADPEALGRVLGHVVENAVTFTDEGRVQVRVWTDSDRAAVEVADTGVGIPAAFLDHVFDPFRQASEGDRRRYEGAGLGLAVAKGCADRMGAEIRVQSAEGEGSRSVVWLPLADVGPVGPRSGQADPRPVAVGQRVPDPGPAGTCRSGPPSESLLSSLPCLTPPPVSATSTTPDPA